MPPRPSPYRPVDRLVSDDFAAYWSGLDKKGLANPAAQEEAVRSAHKYAVCFVALANEAATLPEHRSIFLRELASDSVHLVNCLAGGDGRSTRFYLRSIIENLWRHCYFRDHPVEYGWLSERSGYYLEIKALREYCSWLKGFKGSLKPAFEYLSTAFAELSKHVHSTTVGSLQLKTTLLDIKLSVQESKRLQSQITDTSRSTLVLCLASDLQTYHNLHFNTQDFLRRALDPQRRRWLQASLTER